MEQSNTADWRLNLLSCVYVCVCVCVCVFAAVYFIKYELINDRVCDAEVPHVISSALCSPLSLSARGNTSNVILTASAPPV